MDTELYSALDELNDVLSLIPDTFYTYLSFNRTKAINLLTPEGLSKEKSKLIEKGVNEGIKLTLATIEELHGEIRFRSDNVEASIVSDLTKSMFDKINT